MCTVTYIPALNDRPFVLTSNRDEKDFRSTVPPALYQQWEMRMVYPKDERAGGSWVAMNSNGDVNCLLNGGVSAHKKEDYHTVSRGHVLLDFTSSGWTVKRYFSVRDLGSVEPFTLLSVKQRNGEVQGLVEFIWDGSHKHMREPDIHSPHIWSSVTLYNEEQRKMRRDWLQEFFHINGKSITPEKMMEFHSASHSDDHSVNVIMQRNGGLKTVSITQVSFFSGALKMSYSDLLASKKTEVVLSNAV